METRFVNGIEKRRFMFWMAALIAPSIALLVAVIVASGTWERVRTNPGERTIKVTGSAKQRIISDLIEWSAEVETTADTRTAAYKDLHRQVEAARAYLIKQGVGESEIRVSSVTANLRTKTEYIGSGSNRIQRQIPNGWSTRQMIAVRSQNIEIVEKASRGITSLLEQGVSVNSNAPTYLFTKLDPLKIEMLSRASENARERAQKIIGNGGGGKIGKLWDADMGVINVNPANSVSTSWQGNYDRSSYEKDIIAVVHLTFALP